MTIHLQKYLRVLLLASVFFALSTVWAFAATLSVSPNTAVYTAGQTFTARVVVNTAGKKINAAEGTLSFKPSELSVVRISKGSIFNLWTAEPSFSNSAGTITFSGGTPTGYSGSAGTVLSITFRVKAAGNPKLSFVNGSVLAADGRGTNVLTAMNGATYTIVAQDTSPTPEVVEYVPPANTPDRPVITSTTHPDSDGWYPTKTAELSWNLPSDIVAVRTLLDDKSSSIPTKVYTDPISKITIDDLDEGVQYFHLQFKNSDGWGKVAHYRLAVDSVKPSLFEIALPDDADLSNPEQTLLLRTEDDTSKVATFKIKIDDTEPYEFVDTEGAKRVTLPALDPGYHTVIIEAFDNAGNSVINTLSFTILAFDKPVFTEYPTEVSENVIPVIKGATRPKSKVELSITKIGSDTQTVTLSSDESGEFVYIPESRLSLGVYELSAVAIDQYGAQSEVSDTVRIAVQQPGYLRIGAMAISLLSVVVPLLALVILLLFGLFFIISKWRSFRKGVTKETKEALVMLNTQFTQLQKTLTSEASALANTRKTKKLTKSEVALVESMQEALTSAQQKVTKEMKDVDTLIK